MKTQPNDCNAWTISAASYARKSKRKQFKMRFKCSSIVLTTPHNIAVNHHQGYSDNPPKILMQAMHRTRSPRC